MLQRSGSLYSVCNFKAVISSAYVLLNLRLAHEASRLFASPAKNELATRRAHQIGQIFQRLQTSRVNCRHIAKPENDDGRQFRQARMNFFNLVSGSKKEGAMNTEYSDEGRNFLVLQNMYVAFTKIFFVHLRHGLGDRYCSYEHQRGKNHAGFDGHGEIGKDCKHKCNQPGANLKI